MNQIKQSVFYFFGAIVSLLVCLLELRRDLHFGAFINQFYPCVQDPSQPISCYFGYDLTLIFLSAFVAMVMIFVCIIKVIRYFDKSSFRLSR